MRQAFIYSTKVWLTTLLVAPLLSLFTYYFADWYDQVSYEQIPAYGVFAYLIFYAEWPLLPLVILFGAVTFYLLKTPIKTLTAKCLLTLMAVIICIVPLLMLNTNVGWSSQSLMSSLYQLPVYWLVAVTCIWIYKLRSNNSDF